MEPAGALIADAPATGVANEPLRYAFGPLPSFRLRPRRRPQQPVLARAHAERHAWDRLQRHAHLAYPSPGGPLIQHVKVVDIFYSPGHKYKAMLEDFYKAILQSAYFDWLIEYNVDELTRSAAARSSTSFEDTNPAIRRRSSRVNPETYLKGLLAVSGKLPPPDDDTLYIIYFPSGIDPSDGSGSSCIVAEWSILRVPLFVTLATGGQIVRYAVMPDMEAGSCIRVAARRASPASPTSRRTSSSRR